MIPEKKCMELLTELCVPANLKGYRYLLYAISLSVEDISMIDNTNRRLYPEIAKIHCTTTSAVERCIRHAIEVSFQRARRNVLEKYFGKRSDRVTCSEFIATLVFVMLASEKIPISGSRFKYD